MKSILSRRNSGVVWVCIAVLGLGHTAWASDTMVGVYYYPWHTGSSFHGGNPPGSTTLVYHLDPQQTPELGWYDQWNASVISQHYQWARHAGIKFFVNSYWGRFSTEDNVIQNSMFDNPDRGDIKLCVFLEPSITPMNPSVTPASITTETNYLCDNYFNRPGYFRIDGKPVIFIYVTRAMSESDLTMCISTIRTAATNKGIGDVYIVGDEVWGSPNVPIKTPRVNQMDAISNYDVYGNLGGARFVTDSILDTWQSRNTSWKNLADSLGKQFIPAVSPGFNDRAVRSGHQPSSRKLNNESNAFGTLFSGMLDRVTADMNMVMVTSWNEWHEDTQIEPVAAAAPTNTDDGGGYYTDGLYYNGYGMLYLDILREQTCFIEGDLNVDCRVDFLDFSDLGAEWLTTYQMSDLVLMAQNWLAGVDFGGVSYCDDGTCDPGEDQCNCSEDCGTPPSTEATCDDGIDEDCDTYTDCDDADCDGDPACPACGVKGDPCTTDADCCNTCNTGKGTCK